MCGIFGALTINGRFTKEQFSQFVSLTDMVRYRGPDAAGYRSFRIKGAKDSADYDETFDIFLGHRRLSVIDLSWEGNQPMTNDGNIWITFNGEIFNYIELRDELKEKGYYFKTETDTEVILNLYKSCGASGFTRLNGMWAFALLDIIKKELILSRDRFSIKPLYYTRTQTEFFFASEIKQLLPIIAKREINRDTLFAYLKQGITDYNEETLFKHIYKVKPRHSLIVDLESGALKQTEYWNFHREEMPRDGESVIERFGELLTDSVKIRLRGDVPIGIMLSGGLDSSSIALIASQCTGQKIQCFSSVSHDRAYSEEKFIDMVTEATKLKTIKFLSDPKQSWNLIDQTLWHNEEPFNNLIPVLHYEIMSQIKKYSPVTVLLNGQGGDEILCGYKKFFFFYLHEELRKGRLFNVFKNIMLSFVRGTTMRQFSLAQSKRYLTLFQKCGDPIDGILRFRGNFEPIAQAKNLHGRQILDIEKYSVPYLAHYEDRCSMAHGLEIRLPFLDYRLVNFVLNLPPFWKLNNGWTKYLLRKSMHELPHPVAWRKDKQGFVNPEEKWLRDDFRNHIMETFTTSLLGELGLINTEKLMCVYQKFLAGDKRIWNGDIIRFLIAELWVKKFIMNQYAPNF